MQKKIKSIITHPLFSGSLVMIVGSNMANVFAYLYHLVMGRLLGVDLYGNLAAVISFLSLVAAVFSVFGLVVTRFSATAKTKQAQQEIFSWFASKSLMISAGFSIFVLILTPFLSTYLHIELPLLLLVVPVVFFSMLGYVYRSFLQGLLKFGKLILVSNLELAGRLVLGAVFVVLGLKVFGAVLGVTLATILVYLLLLFLLKDFRFTNPPTKFKGGKDVLEYTIPVFLFSLASTSFLSVDVILAKHFLNSFDAGLYASLATLGKIVVYGAGPVGAVMFPMISQKYARGEGYLQIFVLSVLMILGLSGCVLAIFSLFPTLSISLLYGNSFVSGAPLLIWFGIFGMVYSLVSAFSSFFLSTGRTRAAVLFLLFACVQIVSIYFYHDSILKIISASIVSASLLLLSLIIYLGYEFYTSKAD